MKHVFDCILTENIQLMQNIIYSYISRKRKFIHSYSNRWYFPWMLFNSLLWLLSNRQEKCIWLWCLFVAFSRLFFFCFLLFSIWVSISMVPITLSTSCAFKIENTIIYIRFADIWIYFLYLVRSHTIHSRC